MRQVTRWVGAITALVVGAPVARGQETLRHHVERHRDGLLAVSFAGRADVCTGGTSLRIGGDAWTWVGSTGDGPWAACEPGPVRVLIRRAEGQTVWLRVAPGGPPPEAVTDLGRVPARAAAEYFLWLARTADGRVGRDALLPAVVADSADTWRGLLDLATDRSRARGLRESAVNWLGRELASGTADVPAVTVALSRIVGDADEPSAVRSRAATALGRTGDPRAREALRRAAREGVPGGAERAAVLRALGGREATPADLQSLRDLWPTLADTRSQEAVVRILGEAGGGENVRWLLGVAVDRSATAETRARAVSGAVRAGATTAELARLYDTGPDRRVKLAILQGLATIGDRAALARLVAIAETETDATVRRSAVNRLSGTGSADAVAALREMLDRRP
jgi:HEAT repeat protein